MADWRRLGGAWACLAALAHGLPAQTRTALLADTLARKVEAAKKAGRTGADEFEPRANQILYTLLLISDEDFNRLRAPLAAMIEESRADKQVGGGDSGSGSTSLVMKGSVPSVLGMAVENGALARSISGTTITFRGNPVGIFNALRSKGYFESAELKTPVAELLRRFSFSTSFDASRGNTGEVVFRGDRQQISGFSVRVDLVNQRDPRHARYRAAFAELVAQAGAPLNRVVSRVFGALEVLPELAGLDPQPSYDDWVDQASAKVAAEGAAGLRATIESLLADFAAKFGGERRQGIRALVEKQGTEAVRQLETIDRLDQALGEFGAAYQAYLTSRAGIYAGVKKGSIWTAEYLNSRPLMGPSLSTFRVVAETDFSGDWEFTYNSALTIFNEPLPVAGKSRLRDFQFALQIDKPLGRIDQIGKFLLSFAGKYERLVENVMLPPAAPGARMLAAPNGDIVIAQVKLMIPVKGSGVKIPLSLTVSNRTDLIKEREVRAAVGMTFDLDAIFAKLAR